MALLAGELGIPVARRDGLLPRRGAGGRRGLRPRPVTTCTPGSRSTSRASAGSRSTRRRPRTRSRTTRTRSRGSTRSRRCCSRRPPPQEPVDLPPTLPDDRESEDETPQPRRHHRHDPAHRRASRSAILALLMSPFIVIGAWKAARRRSRRTAARTADRISGGWDELTDRAVDYGARLTPGGTRPEEAAVGGRHPRRPAASTELADRADADVFGPTDPTPEDVEAFWSEVDDDRRRTRARSGILEAHQGAHRACARSWAARRSRPASAACATRRPRACGANRARSEAAARRTPAAPESETP